MIAVSKVPRAGEELGAFLRRDRDSTLCHHPEWPGVIQAGLGREAWFYVAGGADGAIEAAMPVARVKSLLFGDHLVSLPFLNGGGPIGSDAGVEAILTAVREEAVQCRVDSLEVRAAGPLPSDWEPTRRKITVTKDLPPTAEDLWNDGLRSKLRSQIRKPKKEGCEVVVGPGEVDDFYGIFAHNMRDLGTPVLPKRFFEVVRDRLDDMAIFATVRHQGLPVAAGCGFLWRDRFEITWASALRSHSRIAPNMLLYWGLMEHVLSHRGAKVFDFGRCTAGSSTHRFKKQWGTVDVPLPWLSWARREGGGGPSPEDPKFKLATKVWSRLPLAVANRVGPYLSARLP